MEPWKFRRMRRTKNTGWIRKTVIGTDNDKLAVLGAARLSGDQANI